jgi:hypothetical protein
MTKDSSEKSKTTLGDLTKDRRNANQGTKRGQKMIIESIQQDGFNRSGLLDKNNQIIAGEKSTIAAQAVFGSDIEPIIVESDGTRPVYVKRIDLDLSDSDPNNPARRAAYRDNLTHEFSFALNADVVLEDLDLGFDFSKIGVGIDELKAFFAKREEEEKERKKKNIQQPGKRDLPIDLIFTWSEYTTQYCHMAIYSGWLWGVRSTRSVLNHDYNPIHPVSFVDNEYTNYDHDLHLSTVNKFRPKYCTTRDLMDKKQCLEAGIEHFTLKQILQQAEELEQFAENVIIIPKYDCLDKIPEKYILGYSIPTTHGGTPLPPEAFKGRRVHLLGGSWGSQLDYLAKLGDDVVSLDNNYIHKAAEFGSFVYSDGSTNDVMSLFGFPLINHITVAFAISLGMISTKVKELYDSGVQVPGETDNAANKAA